MPRRQRRRPKIATRSPQPHQHPLSPTQRSESWRRPQPPPSARSAPGNPACSAARRRQDQDHHHHSVLLADLRSPQLQSAPHHRLSSASAPVRPHLLLQRPTAVLLESLCLAEEPAPFPLVSAARAVAVRSLALVVARRALRVFLSSTASRVRPLRAPSRRSRLERPRATKRTAARTRRATTRMPGLIRKRRRRRSKSPMIRRSRGFIRVGSSPPCRLCV